MKTDDQTWQLARLFRKAEAFDVVTDLLREIQSIDDKLKQILIHPASQHGPMELQLRAEKSAIESALARHIARMR